MGRSQFEPPSRILICCCHNVEHQTLTVRTRSSSLKSVDKAVEGGILWVSIAGNTAERSGRSYGARV